MRHRCLCLLTLLLTLLPSCSIVDVQPFTTATAEMASAISASLQQVQASVGQADKVFNPNSLQKKEWDADKELLKQSSDRFKQVARSFDAYANALAAVAADGKAHEEKINKVFDATQALATAATDYVGPYAKLLDASIAGLKSAIQTWNTVRTTNHLKALASSEQDSVVQKTARLLRAGLKLYAQVDSGAYNLLLDNDQVHDAATLYVHATQKRRAYAQPRLALLVLGENSLLDQPLSADLLDGDDGYFRKLENLQADADGTIRKAFSAFKKTPTAATSQALFSAFHNREQSYLKLLADNSLPQTVAAAEAKRWDAIYTIPQQKSREQFEKSQQALSAWASSHHEVRLLLLKAGKVTRQDLVGQAQNVQHVLVELKAAKEAAAEAAQAAAQATT